MDFEKTSGTISTKTSGPKLPNPHTDYLGKQHSNTLLQEIEPTNILETTLTFGYKLTLLIGLIIMIILLMKSIKTKKNIMAKEISFETLNHVQTKSIILLILSIISCSPIAIILTIIATIFVHNTKQQFATDFEMAKSKLNTACILNIISIVLIVLGFTLLIFTLLNIALQLLHTF